MTSSKALKSWYSWAVLGAVVVGLLAFGASRSGGPLTTQERVDDISRRIACPVCDGESVFESQNPASVDLRTEIRRQVETGTASDDAIVDYIQQRFGGQVLLVPKATGFDALVWILPVVAFVVAVAGLTVAFRRWKRVADTVPDDDDRQLVEAALDGTGSGVDDDGP
jgi:cytochrome c-type biogenesis protein CcmH